MKIFFIETDIGLNQFSLEAVKIGNRFPSEMTFYSSCAIDYLMANHMSSRTNSIHYQ